MLPLSFAPRKWAFGMPHGRRSLLTWIPLEAVDSNVVVSTQLLEGLKTESQPYLCDQFTGQALDLQDGELPWLAMFSACCIALYRGR